MKRLARLAALLLLLLPAYLGMAAGWAMAVFGDLAAGLPPMRAALLTPRQTAILLAVEDPDFYRHAGISLAAGQGFATLTSAVTRDFYLDGARLGGAGGVFQSAYAHIQHCCKAIDLGRDAMTLVLDAKMSKDRQLDYYVAHVYMGTQAGVQVRGLALAALLYAGKPLAALDEREFIRLAAMIKAPNAYHPLRHPAPLAARAARIEALLAGRCTAAGLSDTLLRACEQTKESP